MHADPLHALTEVVRPQRGVFSVAQAMRQGLTHEHLRGLRRAGLVSRWQPGVYFLTVYPDSWEARAIAAGLALDGRGGLSGWSGLEVYDVCRIAEPELALVALKGRGVTGISPRPRQPLRLRAADLRRVGPFRVPTVEWLLADLASATSTATIVKFGGRALAAGRLDLVAFAELVARFAHCAGVRALRDALTQLHPSLALTRSDAERVVFQLCRQLEVPLPVPDHPVVDASGRQRFLDFAWPSHRVAIEVDLHPLHATTLGRRDDGRRQNDLVGEWVVLRYDAYDLEHGRDVMMRQIAATLQRVQPPPTEIHKR